MNGEDPSGAGNNAGAAGLTYRGQCYSLVDGVGGVVVATAQDEGGGGNNNNSTIRHCPSTGNNLSPYYDTKSNVGLPAFKDQCQPTSTSNTNRNQDKLNDTNTKMIPMHCTKR
jgi:hypothetical protein